MKTNHFLLIILIGLISLLMITFANTKHPTPTQTLPTPQPTISSQNVLGQATKNANCQIQNSLPDKECTPGAIFKNVTVAEICKSGYSASVRDVPTGVKNQVFSEYNITSHPTGAYEVDHLISLELGGNNDLANLWPEPAEPRPGFHEKDKLENHLHDQVCNGMISLEDAQVEIANNWLSTYLNLPN